MSMSTGTCTVTGGYHSYSRYEGDRWNYPDITRTDRVPHASRQAGQQVIGKILRHGEGVTFDRDGKRTRSQVWAAAPGNGMVWLKVYEADALFPGELIIASVGQDGKVTGFGGGSYHPDGAVCRHDHARPRALACA